MKKKPNIVIFNPDSYRGDVVSHLGNPGAVTPHLDALLNDGAVSFSNAFTQNPYCTPSRCSFMTGWYPHVHGHRAMTYMLRPDEPSLFSVLRREGYVNWLSGKNDLYSVKSVEDFELHGVTKLQPAKLEPTHRPPAPLPEGDPRTECYYAGVSTREREGPPANSRDSGHVQAAVDAIRSAPEDQPFCLFVPIGTPHPTYVVEEEFYDMIDPDALPPRLPIPDPTNPYLDAYREIQRSSELSDDDWREIKRVYYAMCAKVDYYFGQVVSALKEQGVYDDTLIIFMSDHGDFTGDYDMVEKTVCSLDDALIRTPFLIKPPADFETRSGIRDQLVELVDMTATIYDMLGIDPGYTCQGISLCDVLRGNEDEIRDAVFAEAGCRRGERHFVNNQGQRMSPDSFYGKRFHMRLPRDLAGSYSVSVRTHRHKYVYRPYNGPNALFNLEEDPGELSNVSGNPDYAAQENALRMRLLEFYATTADVIPYEQDARGF